MEIRSSLRVLSLGILSWAIPYAASLLFYGQGGVLKVSQALFNSAMVVIGGGSGALLLVLAFQRLAPNAVAGLLIGLCWALLNLLFDQIVLRPMMHVSDAAYVAEIGLQYALMPIMAMAMGAAASDKSHDARQAAARAAFASRNRREADARP